MRELHKTHPGETQIKRLAHMFVCWPELDHDDKQEVNCCNECHNCQPNPPVVLLIPWKWPSHPWSRLHVDFVHVGPLRGQLQMFLVVIDAHSKWLEVHPMPTITTQATIQHLTIIFVQFGLPERVVRQWTKLY